MDNFSIGAGGVIFKNESVLLVKIEYGANKGMWMIPGGAVEAGESIEEAAIREVREETGLETEIVRIVSLRSGTQERNGKVQASMYIAFEMKYRSGTVRKDDNEIADIRYWNINEVAEADEIIELSKEIVRAAWNTRNGLYQGKHITTNNHYLVYNYYIPNL